MIRQFELQLHEQYALNNNNKSSSFIALISAFIVSAAGYGYTLATSELRPGITLIAGIALLVILTFLYIVSVYLGSDQRMEQFIVYKIRNKYGNMSDVLPNGYSPYGKGFFTFVQGIYNHLSALFFSFIPLTTISYLYIIKDDKSGLVVSCASLCILLCFFYKAYRFIKYKKRCFNY